MRSYRVLVVDDHPDTAEVLSVLFKMLGHETRSSRRGREALELAREHDFDLILLDIGLPDLSGYEVVRELRADPRRPDRYITAVTGHGRPSDIARSVHEGFDDHVTKPIDLGKVRQILRCADSHYAPQSSSDTSVPKSSPPTPAPA
ncbi:MAG TPA: response regulator [Kofleriaceae bacterium]|nr:response regulator [Kofleriaceae bacterium]